MPARWGEARRFDADDLPRGGTTLSENQQTELSVVVPVLDERGSLEELCGRLREALDGTGRSWEVVFVDDGSTDGSPELIRKLLEDDPRIKLIRLKRNFGQTAALAAGIDHAAGRILIFIDADLQNDPADIPALIERLEDGADVVSGWRRERRDSWLTRIVPSRIANAIISFVTGVRLHDYGCTLKAYRRDALSGFRLYGEMHRFIPVYARWQGARVVEIPVRHHPRRAGNSKYGLGRTFAFVLDLLTVKFLADYSTKPIHMFGGVGVLLCGGGFLAGIVVLVQKFAFGAWAHRNPLLLLAVFLFLLGVQLTLLGLLAEITIRTYHEAQRKPTYAIRETWNLGADPE